MHDILMRPDLSGPSGIRDVVRNHPCGVGFRIVQTLNLITLALVGVAQVFGQFVKALDDFCFRRVLGLFVQPVRNALEAFMLDALRGFAGRGKVLAGLDACGQGLVRLLRLRYIFINALPPLALDSSL